MGNGDTPNNAGDSASYGYVGKYQKETNYTSPITDGIIQMGARVYIPILDRFLQVDPVEGGCLNNYVYAIDPVNQRDLSGRFIGGLIKRVSEIVKYINHKITTFLNNSAQVCAYYGAYLFGRGSSQKTYAGAYRWSADLTNDVKQYKGKNGQHSISLNKENVTVNDIPGKLIIGQVSGGKVSGTVTVNESSWKFTGTIKPNNDTYDFNLNQKRSLLGTGLTATGPAVGEFYRWQSFGLINPMPYELIIEGSVYFEQSGSFE